MSSNPARIAVGNNSKLGKGFGNFNLPILETCPGATEMCRRVCYGRKGNFLFPAVQNRANLNYEGAQRSDFVATIANQIRRSKMKVLRLHSTGDFFDPNYALAWASIALACPSVQFGAYTRSWSVSTKFVSRLREFADLPNVQLFLSVDEGDSLCSSPSPDLFRFRFAYMNREWQRPAGSLRCPNQVQKERGKPAKELVTCERCMICYKDPAKYPDVEFKIH